MTIIRKDATITPTGAATDFPGTFEVVLSAPTKDRDGDTLLPGDWKTPLPDHITFDQDHAMTVAGTVGSGAPRIDDETGNLIVSGTYSSLARAQEVRTLVNEGHIRTTSVAFMTESAPQKDGKTRQVRELLNGAFVAIPSNREALVLSSKSGARNSKSDAEHVQAIHDHAMALGAMESGKAYTPSRKDAGNDTGAAAQAVDAALDEALSLLAGVDLTTLPAEVQQAVGLVQAAEAACDDLLDALGVPDPDDEGAESGADTAPAAGALAAPAAGATSAPVKVTDSDAVTAKDLEDQALLIQAAQFI